MGGSGTSKPRLTLLGLLGFDFPERLLAGLETRFDLEVRHWTGESRPALPAEGPALLDVSPLERPPLRELLAALDADDHVRPLVLLIDPSQEALALEAVRAGVDDYFRREEVCAEDVSRALACAQERRALVDGLRAKERGLRDLVAQIPGVIWTTDAKLRFTSAQGSALAELGREPEEGLDLGHDDFFGTSDSKSESEAAHELALREGAVARFEQRVGDRSFDCSVRRLTGSGGDVIGTIGLGVDVTERRQAEEEVRRVRDRLATILENLLEPFGVYTAVRDESGTIQDFLVEYVNPAAAENLAIPRERQVGRRLLDLLPAHAESGLFDRYCRVVEEGEPLILEAFPFEDPAVEEVQGLFDIMAFKLTDGLGIAWREVSSHVRQAEELRRSEERLRAVVERAPLILFTLDLEGTITSAVGGAFSDLGLEAHELVGRSAFELDDDPEVHRDLEAALRGEESSSDWTLRGRTLTLHHVPRRDSEGAVTGAICVAVDQTERQQLEAQLRQARKMEALGRLAGGIAHDFNNVLTAIKGNAQLLSLLDGPGGEEFAEYVEEIAGNADRAAALTRQLLTFSRQQPREPAVLDLSEVVERALQLIRRVIGADLAISTRLAEDLPVFVDRNRVEQVLLNLAINARDAMPSGGDLWIETRVVELEGEMEMSHGKIEPGTYAQLVVSDTGVGMDAATREKIFEPFFTTKPLGKGTGLGLSTVWGIVTQAGGHVHVYSEPGQGTAFRIYLPLAPEDVQPVATGREREAKEPRGPRRRGTILVVEDDPAVLSLTVRVLGGAGYSVLQAAHGGKALEVVEDRDEPVQLLLTDVTMPELTGPELAVRLRQRWPELRVLFLSGYSEDELQERRSSLLGAPFLQKPFDVNELLEAVDRVLSDAPG